MLKRTLKFSYLLTLSTENLLTSMAWSRKNPRLQQFSLTYMLSRAAWCKQRPAPFRQERSCPCESHQASKGSATGSALGGAVLPARGRAVGVDPWAGTQPRPHLLPAWGQLGPACSLQETFITRFPAEENISRQLMLSFFGQDGTRRRRPISAKLGASPRLINLGTCPRWPCT